MKVDQPTAAQKRWREAVRELGSVISGGPAVIHHPVGRTARHNKVAIGHWWVIPLTDEEHKALHNGQKPWKASENFESLETRKEFEKIAFKFWIVDTAARDGYLPDEYGYDINHAIMDYHV